MVNLGPELLYLKLDEILAWLCDGGAQSTRHGRGDRAISAGRKDVDDNLAGLRGALSSYSRTSNIAGEINVTGGTWPKHKRGGHGSTATRVEAMRE